MAWKALDRDGPNGVVTFHKLDDSRTKVMVQMDYEPEGMKESVGSLVGFDGRRVKGDLESFKEFVESRGSETGAWRGSVDENWIRRGLWVWRRERQAHSATSSITNRLTRKL